MSKKLTIDQKIRILKEEKLKRLRAEAKLTSDRLRWRKDPLTWLSERLGEDPKLFEWSLFGDKYDTHKWDGDINPLASAWRSVSRGRWTAIEAATGVGKTYILARIVLWFLDSYEGSTVATIAVTGRQLKKNLWKEVGELSGRFKKLYPKSELFTLELRMDNSKDKKEGEYGWEATGIAVDTKAGEVSSTSIQGLHNTDLLIVIEEMAGIGAPPVEALMQTCVADNNIIIGVGNPDSNHDMLHQFSDYDFVDNYRVSALDHPNIVFQEAKIQGAVQQKSIDMRESRLGVNSAMYKSRVRGISPAQSEHALILAEWFDQCIDLVPEKSSFNSLGVDVAKSESGDKGAVARFKGAILNYISDFTCPDASDIAYNLLYDNMEIEARGYNNYNLPTMKDSNVEAQDTGVDVVGVGASTVEMFSKLGMTVVGISGGQWKEAIPIDPVLDKPLYNFVSFRAQIWWQLRMDLQRGELGIHLQDKTLLNRLRKDALSVRKKEHPKGIALELKTDLIKRTGYSPNLGDAFAYANWMRHGFRRQSSVYFPLGA